MKLVMTRVELEKACRSYNEDESGDSLPITPDKDSPSGYATLIDLNHWQMTIPIEVQG